MLKRISKGLDPIEKEVEEESQQQQLEEGNDDNNYNNNNNNNEQIIQDANNDKNEPEKGTDLKASLPSSETSQQGNPKRFKCHKPVPDDYTCAACQNTVSPRHWIYDCPKKQKYVSASTSNDKKVFVSGLPFDATHRSVVTLLGKHAQVRIVHCKLLKFEDSKRCKGQAYVTLESAVDAQQLRTKLDGWTIPPQYDTTDNSDITPQDHPSNKKVLRLKVSKVLNRNVTKKKQQQHKRKHAE
jgi:hypothetical protein